MIFQRMKILEFGSADIAHVIPKLFVNRSDVITNQVSFDEFLPAQMTFVLFLLETAYFVNHFHVADKNGTSVEHLRAKTTRVGSLVSVNVVHVTVQG